MPRTLRDYFAKPFVDILSGALAIPPDVFDSGISIQDLFETSLIEKAYWLLMNSPTFKAMHLQRRDINGWDPPVEFTRMHALGLYTRHKILLAKTLLLEGGIGLIADILCHEFRHVWQDARNVMIDMSSPYEKAYRTSIKEADATAFQLTVLYELKEQGLEENWRDVAYFFKTNYPLAWRAFEGAVNSNPQALYNGDAQNAVLRAWAHDRGVVASDERTTIRMFEQSRHWAKASQEYWRSKTPTRAKFEQKIFDMPYAEWIGDEWIFHPRTRYGRLSKLDRMHLEGPMTAGNAAKAKFLAAYQSKFKVNSPNKAPGFKQI
ncbi:MAG TPA: DUF6782 family putative metallopeptidase [Alphaproteobacteria bacterium]